MEKYPAQTIPSAEDGSALPCKGADGKQFLPVAPDASTAELIQKLDNIDNNIARLVFLLERYLEDDSSDVTSNNGA